MEKIKKGLNLKIIALITTSMFLLNSTVYGIDLSNKIHLRVPLQDVSRFKKGLVSLSDDPIKNTSDISHKETDGRIFEILNKKIKEYGIGLIAGDLPQDGDSRYIENPKLLYDRLCRIFDRKAYDDQAIMEDINTIMLFYYYCAQQKGFSAFNKKANLLQEYITREGLVKLIRIALDPLFEFDTKDYFVVFDLFAGKRSNQITNLPYEELNKLGAFAKPKMLTVGVDKDVSWEDVEVYDLNVAVKRPKFLVRGDVHHFIGNSQADLVTMSHPEHFLEIGTEYTEAMPFLEMINIDYVEPNIMAAKKMLKPGGWIYIQPHPRGEYAKDDKLYIEALHEKGFMDINAIRPYPNNFPYSLWYGMPSCLIVARLPNLSEGEYDFMPGEILQFKGKGGVLLIGDHESGKSGLAIKILDNDKRWECVSCGASSVTEVDLGTKKILLGKRRSADNVIYSRLLGKREFLLSQEETVIIKWIIVLDDTAEDFLRQARDYGIRVIKIDNSDMYSKFEELLQRINSTIDPEESIDIQNASVEILLTDESKQVIPFKGLQTEL